MRTYTLVQQPAASLIVTPAPRQRQAPVPPPAPRPDRAAPYANTAPHIRGHVKFAGRTATGVDHYWYTVTNISTGARLARSDEFGLQNAIAACHEAVAVARASWFWDFDAYNLSSFPLKSMTIGAKDAQSILTVLTGSQPEDIEPLVAKLVALLG